MADQESGLHARDAIKGLEFYTDMASISIAGDATSSPIGLTYKLKQTGYIQKNTSLGGNYSSTMNTVMAGGKRKACIGKRTIVNTRNMTS